MPSKKSSIVIVGGGHVGATIARSLSQSLNPSKHDLILVNPLPYTIIRPASLRMVVSDVDKLEDKILVPFDKLFYNNNGKLIQGQVTQIDEANKVICLQSGETVPFDILVLATGQKWEGPIAIPEQSEVVDGFIQERRNEFKNARNILLVGGGAVGIELAGEIRDIWGDKKVTLIQRDRLLLNGTYPDRMRKAMQKQLEARGVEVILDDYLENSTPGPSSGTITTKKGVTLRPDLIVHTWGPRPNTEFIGSSLGGDVLTEKGFVKVKPTMQVINHPDIFAAGDIIEWNEQKMIMKGQGHAKVIIRNIMDRLSGKTINASYNGSPEAILVTNGKDAGTLYVPILWGLLFGSWISSPLKSKELFVPRSRVALGYQ